MGGSLHANGPTGPMSPPATPACHSDVTGLSVNVESQDPFDKSDVHLTPLTPRLPDSPDPSPKPSPTPKAASTFQASEASEKLQTLPPNSSQRSASSEPQSKTKGKPKSRSPTEDDHLSDYPRISKPVELLRASYDVVVIGSGYGGGVAASRMARTGQSVCLLERGREKWPGEYPSDTADALKEMHVSGTFAPGQLKGKMVNGGDPTGMYHLIFGRGQNAVVCNGKSKSAL